MAADAKRGLTAAGRDEIEEVARSLSRLKVKPDLLATSPLVRARETAEIVAKVQRLGKVQEWEELKPEGDRLQLYSRLSRLRSDSSVLVVGHEPYLSSMISDVIGVPGGRLILKKGGVARVRLDAFLPKARGELRWLLTPGLLRKF